LTDCLTIYVAISIFASKNYFCHPVFRGKNVFLPPTGKNLPTLTVVWPNNVLQ